MKKYYLLLAFCHGPRAGSLPMNLKAGPGLPEQHRIIPERSLLDQDFEADQWGGRMAALP